MREDAGYVFCWWTFLSGKGWHVFFPRRWHFFWGQENGTGKWCHQSVFRASMVFWGLLPGGSREEFAATRLLKCLAFACQGASNEWRLIAKSVSSWWSVAYVFPKNFQEQSLKKHLSKSNYQKKNNQSIPNCKQYPPENEHIPYQWHFWVDAFPFPQDMFFPCSVMDLTVFPGFWKVGFSSRKKRQVREDVNQLGGFTVRCVWVLRYGGGVDFPSPNPRENPPCLNLGNSDSRQLKFYQLVDPLDFPHRRILGAPESLPGMLRGQGASFWSYIWGFCHRFYYLLPFLSRPEWCFSPIFPKSCFCWTRMSQMRRRKKMRRDEPKTRFIRPNWTPTPT